MVQCFLKKTSLCLKFSQVTTLHLATLREVSVAGHKISWISLTGPELMVTPQPMEPAPPETILVELPRAITCLLNPHPLADEETRRDSSVLSSGLFLQIVTPAL